MSDDIEDLKQCEAIEDELTEFALGILSARRRSEVLRHVGSCVRCSAELERLSIVADTVLDLAPEMEPPLGFELRLAERLQKNTTVLGSQRLHRVRALSAAAVLTVVIGIGLGTLATSRSPNTRTWTTTASLTSAAIGSRGQVLGAVFISAGSPGWMVLTVDRGAWSGEVTCEVTFVGGQVETLGRFKLSNGYGTWGVPLTSSAGQVRNARLVALDGTVIANAHLTT
ncbi:MAG TPA: zf-HC2 domain-containing protein [Acidimicrobiales bacterium]|nr:zf-HC2 domain-containing protein [Acidimicrobiales bacterium]